MKLFVNLLLLLLGGFVFGNTPHNSYIIYNPLIGKWDLKSISLNIVDLDSTVIKDVSDQSTLGQMTMQFDFRVDNKVAYFGSAFNAGDPNSYEDIGTYQIIDDNITITINKEPLSFKIIYNDEKNLHLELSSIKDFQGKKIKQILIYKFDKIN